MTRTYRRKTNRTYVQTTSLENFIERSIQKFGTDKYDLSNVASLTHSKERIQIRCKVHNLIFDIRADQHLQTGGFCTICKQENKIKPKSLTNQQACNILLFSYLINKSKQTKLEIKLNTSNELLINNLQKKYGERYSLVECDVTNRYGKFTIKCNLCGKEFQTTKHDFIYHCNHGCGCLTQSFGELTIKNYLIEHNITFEQQKTFTGCKSKTLLRFDFYLPKHNSVIEYMGEQHFDFIPLWHKTYTQFLKSQQRDVIKYRFCVDNNIHYIDMVKRLHKTKQQIYNYLDSTINTLSYPLVPNNIS